MLSGEIALKITIITIVINSYDNAKSNGNGNDSGNGNKNNNNESNNNYYDSDNGDNDNNVSHYLERKKCVEFYILFPPINS